MSETLILAAIIAPLVLVPAVILSLQQAIDPDCRIEVDLIWGDVPSEPESEFAKFEREMLDSIVDALGISKELLTGELNSSGSSWYATSLECYRKYGPWL